MDPPGTQLFSAVDAAKRIWPERRQNGCPQEAKSLMAGRRDSVLKEAEKHWQRVTQPKAAQTSASSCVEHRREHCPARLNV